MITLKRNRAADIEAPCLHSNNEETVWKAHLFNHDDPANITDDVEGIKDEDTGIIVFSFSVEQINKFADGDRLDIEIWPSDNDTDMYWEDKAFKVEDSQVPVTEQNNG